MKQLIFLLCLCVTITTIVGSWVDDISETVANRLSLPITDVKTCFLETNVTLNELSLSIGQIIYDRDTDTQNSALRVGCALACVFKKKEWMDGKHFNVEKIKNDMSLNNSNPERLKQILDTCIDEVKDLINECEVIPHLIKCMILEEG